MSRKARTEDHPQDQEASNGTYSNGCRCVACKKAHAAYMAAFRRQGKEPPRHGTESGYANYGCRCPACSAARRAVKRQHPTTRNEFAKALQESLPSGDAENRA